MNVVYVEFCQSSTPCLHCHEYYSQFMRGFQILYVQIIWLKTAQGKLDFKYFRNWNKKGRKGVMTFALSSSLQLCNSPQSHYIFTTLLYVMNFSFYHTFCTNLYSGNLITFSFAWIAQAQAQCLVTIQN